MMEKSSKRTIHRQQRNIIIWVNSLHFVELPETSTYEWKSIKKKSYLKLILIKWAKIKSMWKHHNKDSRNKKQLLSMNQEGRWVMWNIQPNWLNFPRSSLLCKILSVFNIYPFSLNTPIQRYNKMHIVLT